MEEDAAVADAAGVGDPIRVDAYPDLPAAAERAAVAAARRLNVRLCRVQGVNALGEVFSMVVDSETETLLADGAAEAATHAPRGRGRASKRAGRVSRRGWLVIGVTVVAVTAVAVVAIPRALLPEPAPVETAAAAPVVNDAPIPEPGQLPVQAPVGWDTYAGWVVDSAKPGAAAVLVGRDTLVIVEGGTVIGLDAETGQEQWRGGTSADVSQLRVSDDATVIYAAHDTRGVSVLDAETGRVLGNVDVAADSITLADVPFASLPGQAGAVLVGTQWERRQVPATAVPVGTLGDALVSVSIERSQLWVTNSDDPVLPDGVALAPPAEGLVLSRVVTFLDGRMITQWADGSNRRVLAIDVVDEEGGLERTVTFDLPAGSSAGVSVDEPSGLVGVGGLLIDVAAGTSVSVPQGTAVARAGFGWTATGMSRVRIDPSDGATRPMSRGAIIPDLVLPDGRAVVRADRGADGQAYYALEISQPSASPSPDPTPTPETTPTDEEDE